MPLDIFTPLDVSTQQISHDFVQLDVYKAQKIDCDSFSDFYLMVRLSQIMYFSLLHFILFILLNTKYTILFQNIPTRMAKVKKKKSAIMGRMDQL